MHGVDVNFISIIMFSSYDMYDGSMRRHKKILLLGLFYGEQGNICSHFLYDVAGVGDGTIMVKRGYSFAFNDQ